jgi:hypothetical protein
MTARLKFARTIADLAGTEKILNDDISEAIQFWPWRHGSLLFDHRRIAFDRNGPHAV